MKRILSAVLAMLMVASVSLTSMAQSKPAPKKVTATPKTDTVHLKKDGTKDRRFKENKTPAGPLKKDGTPDKRYKANKKS